jgi:hypothetical protein
MRSLAADPDALADIDAALAAFSAAAAWPQRHA